MRFAINLPSFGDFGYPHRLAELAHETEAAGWDGFFVWDHAEFFVPGDDPARASEIVAPYAEAGLTWWNEGLPDFSASIDAVRTRIRQGPPRLP